MSLISGVGFPVSVLVLYDNHRSKTHRFELGAWTVRRTDDSQRYLYAVTLMSGAWKTKNSIHTQGHSNCPFHYTQPIVHKFCVYVIILIRQSSCLAVWTSTTRQHHLHIDELLNRKAPHSNFTLRVCNEIRAYMHIFSFSVKPDHWCHLRIFCTKFFKHRSYISHFYLLACSGNWTTRGYANSRIANSRTGQLAVSQMPPKRKTKHAKSPIASASCPVTPVANACMRSSKKYGILACGPMPNIGGALCSMPQSLADAHYLTAVQ